MKYLWSGQRVHRERVVVLGHSDPSPDEVLEVDELHVLLEDIPREVRQLF